MSQVTFSFDGMHAVVTGGAGGIGREIVDLLAASGADVVVWDRASPETAGRDVRAPSLAVDVTDEESVRAALRETVGMIGRVDVLISCAGITGPVANAWEYDAAAWRRVVDIDLTGAFLVAKAVVPEMRRRGYGRIITVASIAGKEATPMLAAYVAAKHGVVGMTKAFGRELAGSGVTVNAVAPVMVETELFAQLTPEFIERTQALIPMQRFLTAGEVAATVAWIASDQSSFTTGQVFDLSGGRADY
ncbi:SDR family NAD(P)-dependent oxidoreductase [Microbacterium elymi]|uniref:SDR family oxidoreductase n=1 Tax=Microbacterium elymi TaxID=2909587 RepID=A0ABY5NM01_9MICO|nr:MULTISPECIES: SDR family NAD(P)-dependent oxidoreductase [Microbacterium]UUT36175.1 SDR family oxidoreductase [Microbacterium elymi]